MTIDAQDPTIKQDTATETPPRKTTATPPEEISLDSISDLLKQAEEESIGLDVEETRSELDKLFQNSEKEKTDNKITAKKTQIVEIFEKIREKEKEFEKLRESGEESSLTLKRKFFEKAKESYQPDSSFSERNNSDDSVTELGEDFDYLGLIDKKEEIKKLVGKITTIQNQLDEQQKNREKVEKLVKSQKPAFDQLDKKIQEEGITDQSILEKIAKFRKIEKILTKVDQIIAEYEDKIQKFKKEKKALIKECYNLCVTVENDSYDELKAKNRTLEEKLETISTEIKKLKSSSSKLEEEAIELEIKNNQIEQNIIEIQENRARKQKEKEESSGLKYSEILKDSRVTELIEQMGNLKALLKREDLNINNILNEEIAIAILGEILDQIDDKKIPGRLASITGTNNTNGVENAEEMKKGFLETLLKELRTISQNEISKYIIENDDGLKLYERLIDGDKNEQIPNGSKARRSLKEKICQVEDRIRFYRNALNRLLVICDNILKPLSEALDAEDITGEQFIEIIENQQEKLNTEMDSKIAAKEKAKTARKNEKKKEQQKWKDINKKRKEAQEKRQVREEQRKQRKYEKEQARQDIKDHNFAEDLRSSSTKQKRLEALKQGNPNLEESNPTEFLKKHFEGK